MFFKIKNWVKELKTALGDDCVIFVVGNKADLEKDRNVSIQEAENYSKSVGALHFSTSAKLNQGVHEIFFEISKSNFCFLFYEIRFKNIFDS
jgi:Ras-related protein Rab-21